MGTLLPISVVFLVFLVSHRCCNNAIHPPHLSGGSRPRDSSRDWPHISVDKLLSFHTITVYCFVYLYIPLMQLFPAIAPSAGLMIFLSSPCLDWIIGSANVTPTIRRASACCLTVVRYVVAESLNLTLLLWSPERVASLKSIRGISRGLLSVLIG